MNAARAAGAPSVQAGEIARPRAAPRGRPPADRPLRGGPPARGDGRGARRPRGAPRPGRRPAARPVRRRSSRAPVPTRSRATDRLEELLLTRIANENPAIGPLRELVDDRAARREHALSRGDRRARGRRSPTDRPSDDDGTVADRAHARCRPGTRRPRWPASSATSASAGARCWATSLEDLLGRLDLAIGILAEEERALHLRFGGGGAAAAGGARPRRRRSRAPPTSPRRSRPTRPGCRRSC